jgi:hypothetical protein
MAQTMFHDVAAAEGWTDATQVTVLLRYVEQRASPKAFAEFLDQQRAERAGDENPRLARQDRFMWEVVALLRDPGLALQPDFQSYCANCHDLLTPLQAAERWCCWRAG